MIITENGWPDRGELQDDDRVEYYQKHLQQVLNVIRNDGCNVKGYTAWSIIDNFEWHNGYTYVKLFGRKFSSSYCQVE